MRLPLFVMALALVAGCNVAKYKGQTTFDASCPSLVEYPCKPGASSASSDSACSADPNASDKLARGIPLDASYPPGCTVIVPDPTPDEVGQCIFAGSCRCTSSDGGAPRWVCTD